MYPLAKSIKGYVSLKVVVICLIVVVLITYSGVAVYGSLKGDDEELNDDPAGRLCCLKSTKIFKQLKEKVSLREDKTLLINRNKSSNVNGLYLKRATPVRLQYDKMNYRVMTFEKTVRNLLEKENVILNEKDKLIGPGLDEHLDSDEVIKIVRVNEKEKVEDVEVPFKVVKKENGNIEYGVNVTRQQGVKGIKKVKFKEIYEDEKVVSKIAIEEEIVQEPVNEVIEYGTKKVTARGLDLDFRSSVIMTATGYTSSYRDTGKRPGEAGFGITSSGMRARRGLVAVDPRVIPIGTRLYIEGIGGTRSYGYAIAADTGGAIKGNKIDLYFESSYEAYNWGVRKVKVYILN